jgi:hypothetical protein
MMMKYERKKQTSFSPYGMDILPSGFVYPKRYLELSKHMDLSDIRWWFENSDTEAGLLSWEFRHEWGKNGWLYLDVIDPIPFARFGDLATYFDGNDKSGNPMVVEADLGNKGGSHKYADFDAWLSEAMKD